jgi:DNA-binding NarL/FixJ family response regulator
MRIVICDAHRVFADALESMLAAAGHHVVGSAVDLDEATRMLDGAAQGGRPPATPPDAAQGGRPAATPPDAAQGGRPAATPPDAAQGAPPFGEPVDACVVDLRLPRSGKRPDLGQAVAAATGTAFVALSAGADPSSLRHAVAAGVRGVALKGDDFGEFLRVLTDAVRAQGLACRDASSAKTGPVILSTSARAALRRGDGLAAGPSQFLTEREREALGRLVRGESTAAMARAMGVRVSTARTHIDAVLGKLGAHTRLEAVAYAVREGIVDMSGWQVEEPAVGT